MIRAAIVGIGTWGQNLVASVQGSSIDAAVLATPHSMHAAQIVAAAKAGKHVFTEKPLGLDKESSERAVAACAERGVTLRGGLQLALPPGAAELEHFARAVKERRGLALAGGDEVHNVAVLEAIVRSARDGGTIRIA